MEHIFFWTRHDAYGFLSNFYRTEIKIDGETWPTTEHYYQAMKSLDKEIQEKIKNLPKPGNAKQLGKHIKLRKDWEEVKEEIMLKALRAKFAQHPNFGKRLLDTKEAILHEDSPWDMYWGYVKGRGKDRLGVLLMQVRKELRNDKDL